MTSAWDLDVQFRYFYRYAVSLNFLIGYVLVFSSMVILTGSLLTCLVTGQCIVRVIGVLSIRRIENALCYPAVSVF